MLYNAIANNGKMMKPYLVNKIRSNNGFTVKEFHTNGFGGADLVKRK
jgi:cell division protein FtsI/penicillin-binding protein 2